MIAAILALALSIAGVVCLYSGWRQRTASTWRRLGAWLLLGFSVPAWIVASSAEFGVVYAFMALSVLAWLVVLVNFEIRQQRHKEKVAGEIVVPDAKAISRHLLLFVASVPLAGAAAVLGAAALTLLIPWETVNSIVFAMTIMPVLWGLAAYWACADEKLFRPLLGLASFAGLSAALIYL